MIDFERERAHMVEGQLRAGGVTVASILAQMRSLPRENFVSPERRDIAYIDDVQWLGDRFLVPPAVLGKLLRLAEITPRDAVLDVGAATGYSTAVIAGLAASVTALEQDAALTAAARQNLAQLGLTNATFVNGGLGDIGQALYDAIVVQGALRAVPESLLAALAEGGRLVVVLQKGPLGIVQVFVKTVGQVTARSEFNVTLPLLYADTGEPTFVF